jgi:hypothetical protein
MLLEPFWLVCAPGSGVCAGRSPAGGEDQRRQHQPQERDKDQEQLVQHRRAIVDPLAERRLRRRSRSA